VLQVYVFFFLVFFYSFGLMVRGGLLIFFRRSRFYGLGTLLRRLSSGLFLRKREGSRRDANQECQQGERQEPRHGC
jgi:hypothetical protein